MAALAGFHPGDRAAPRHGTAVPVGPPSPIPRPGTAPRPRTNPAWCPRHSPGERRWGHRGRWHGIGVTLGTVSARTTAGMSPIATQPIPTRHGPVSRRPHGSVTPAWQGARRGRAAPSGQHMAVGSQGSRHSPGTPHQRCFGDPEQGGPRRNATVTSPASAEP